jgi:hypothetical protein
MEGTGITDNNVHASRFHGIFVNLAMGALAVVTRLLPRDTPHAPQAARPVRRSGVGNAVTPATGAKAPSPGGSSGLATPATPQYDGDGAHLGTAYILQTVSPRACTCNRRASQNPLAYNCSRVLPLQPKPHLVGAMRGPQQTHSPTLQPTWTPATPHARAPPPTRVSHLRRTWMSCGATAVDKNGSSSAMRLRS